MSDEINDDTPAVTDDLHDSTVEWSDLSVSQKLDVIHMKLDALAYTVDGVDKGQSQIWGAVDWTAKTIDGLSKMAANLNPGDIFKAMLKGGK